MNWKKILALAFFLAALVALIATIDRKEKGRLATEGILLDIPSASIDRIELRNSVGRFVFSRRDTRWLLEEPLAAKADKAVLENILDNFCQLKYDRLVQEEGGDLKTFGLDKPEIELRLMANGRPAAAVLLGMKNSLDNSSYAMLAAGGRVVTIAGYRRVDLEKDLFAFRDKKFFEIDTMAVTALDYRFGDSALALVKKDDRWFLEKPVYSLANEAKVNDILAAAATLEALSFAPAAAEDVRRKSGIDKPLFSAEFRFGDLSRRILVGKQDEEFFAWVEGSDEICSIHKDFLDKFVADAAALREKKVAPFYAYDIRELFFRQGAFQFTVRKDAAGTWEFVRSVPGKKPAGDKIDGLLTTLAGLEAGEFIDAPTALPAYATRIVLKADDQAGQGKQGEIVMEFSAPQGETVIARNPALPYLFKVGRDILEKFPVQIEDVAGEDAAAPETGK